VRQQRAFLLAQRFNLITQRPSPSAALPIAKR
jgi:hypothetical protein